MPERRSLFAANKHPVLSVGVRAEFATPPRQQSQFEVLVRHLLDRFFHNELLTSDDETKRVMLISYTVALPGLFVALMIFPAYHAYPGFPFHRDFWTQVGDHYFYVMYSMIAMGAATVYEWDLLFPDLLDVFILSVLPMSNRRLFFARVLALVIFLALVLAGTSILGAISHPLLAALPDKMRWHFLAHAVAVTMSGAFGAATFLALQGVLINTVGERLFRRLTPLLQGVAIMVLLAMLFLYPMLTRSLQPLLTSGSPLVRCFPPFWFLGIYERILGGPSAPAIFGSLARTGVYALIAMMLCALLTYPLAYRRKVRQIIEGANSSGARRRSSGPLSRFLDVSVLRRPIQRAVFHFISQTILRSQRHRVMLAMYGGLGIALAIANMVALRITSGHVRFALEPRGIRAAVPILIFWTVSGFSSILGAPVDRRGTWLFRVTLGRPRLEQLEGARMWVVLWAAIAGLATVIFLHFLSPGELRTPLVTIGQILVAAGLSLLLGEAFLLGLRTVPFTHLRKSAITDFPLMLLRSFVIFPCFVLLVLRYERWIELSVMHLAGTLLFIAAVYLLLQRAREEFLQQLSSDIPLDNEEEYPQRLGLGDA